MENLLYAQHYFIHPIQNHLRGYLPMTFMWYWKSKRIWPSYMLLCCLHMVCLSKLGAHAHRNIRSFFFLKKTNCYIQKYTYIDRERTLIRKRKFWTCVFTKFFKNKTKDIYLYNFNLTIFVKTQIQIFFSGLTQEKYKVWVLFCWTYLECTLRCKILL